MIDVKTIVDCLLEEQKLYGYRAVGVRDNGVAYSLYDPRITFSLDIGEWTLCPTEKGFHLGSDKQFVLDYYSGLTDDKEYLLTYEFGENDIIAGSVDQKPVGEIRVKRMKLVDIEYI